MVLSGNVDRLTLLGLMRPATVVVVPSLYEGFGFPAVEAMACGTAVVATRVASLPEICGDSALLCEVDAESMALAVQRVIDDDQLRARLIVSGAARARTLTWQAAADQHLAVYRHAIENT